MAINSVGETPENLLFRQVALDGVLVEAIGFNWSTFHKAESLFYQSKRKSSKAER